MIRAALALLLCAPAAAQVWAPAPDAFFEQLGAARERMLSAAAVSRAAGRAAPGQARAAIRARALERGVPAEFVERALADPRLRHLPEILDKFGGGAPGAGPAESEWERYRRIFLTEERARAGADFLRQHAALLAEVERRHGVDPALLTALCGVETYYGSLAGTFPVLSVFFTVAQSLPERADWYVREAAEFLRLAWQQGYDANAVLGSYAGAFGLVQFMPSSHHAFAVDHDGDGLRRLDQWPDALASAANYLGKHGYRAGDSFTPDSTIGRSLWRYNRREAYVRAILELRLMILARSQSAT